jgi:hypothetical protein
MVFYWIGYGAAVASRFFIKYLLPFFVFMARRSRLLDPCIQRHR